MKKTSERKIGEIFQDKKNNPGHWFVKQKYGVSVAFSKKEAEKDSAEAIAFEESGANIRLEYR